MAYFSTLAWKIPWMEEPGGLQSMGSLGVGHDWATSLCLFTFMHWRRKCNPLQYSCLENPRDGGAWCATIYVVTQSGTRLKRLSSSSGSAVSWQNSVSRCPASFCTGGRCVAGRTPVLQVGKRISYFPWRELLNEVFPVGGLGTELPLTS